MNIRLSFPSLIAAGLLALGASDLHAAMNGDLVLLVNRENGNMSLTGASATVVNLAGYAIGSSNGTIQPASFNGLSDTETDWVSAGASSAAGVQELISNGSPTAATVVDNITTFDLGTGAYNPTQALLDAGFGVDVEQNDLSLTFYDTIDNATYTGAVLYQGEKMFNNIGMTIDLNNGTAIIENESPFDRIITGYLIEAATAGTLNTSLASFNGVRDETGGSGFQAPATLDGENLGELDPTGVGIALNAGQSYSLGVVGGTLDDLSFSFLLAGTGSTSMNGFVKYVNASTGLNGDYNEDGNVDAADYVIWRDNLGAAIGTLPNDPNMTTIGQDQYDTWRANFGATVESGASATAAATIPEPDSVAIALAGLVAIGAVGRRRVAGFGSIPDCSTATA